MKSIINLLIVEDEAYDVKRILATLEHYKNYIKVQKIVSTGKEAVNLIIKDTNKFDVVVLDYQISGGLFGVDLIKEIKRVSTHIQVVIITKMTLNHTDLNFAAKLLESGASWFGTKNPLDIEDFIYQPTDFVLAIQNAYEKSLLEKERNLLLNERDDSVHKLENKINVILTQNKIIGNSDKINQVKVLISRYADIDAAVLVTGESGTGKELVAAHLHFNGRRRFEQLINVNCSAIPEQLFESELFGHEKGAFTDARSEKKGFFEQAEKGTLFLDEVGELSLQMQAKLLRALETGEIDKIGRKTKLKVDVRIIAATNKDLKQMINDGLFRRDLFYRLNILNIFIPPLRERPDDVEALIDHFLENYCREHSIKKPLIAKEAREFFFKFEWDGNIRQVKNLTLRMLLLQNGTIDMNVVRLGLGTATQTGVDRGSLNTNMPEEIIPLREAELNFRKKYVSKAIGLFKTDAETARHLGIAKSNFHRLLKDLNLK